MEPCGHLICHVCLKQLLQTRQPYCPFCRERIKDSEPVCVAPFAGHRKSKSTSNKDVPLGSYELATAIVDSTISSEEEEQEKEQHPSAATSGQESSPKVPERRHHTSSRPKSMVFPTTSTSDGREALSPIYTEIMHAPDTHQHFEPQKQWSTDYSRFCFVSPANTSKATCTETEEMYATLFAEQYSSNEENSSSPSPPPPLKVTGSTTDPSLSEADGKMFNQLQFSSAPLRPTHSLYSDQSSFKSYDASHSESVSSCERSTQSPSRPRIVDNAQHEHKESVEYLTRPHAMQRKSQTSLATVVDALSQHVHGANLKSKTLSIRRKGYRYQSPKQEPCLTGFQLQPWRSERSLHSNAYDPAITAESPTISNRSSPLPSFGSQLHVTTSVQHNRSIQDNLSAHPCDLNSTRPFNKVTGPFPDSASHQKESQAFPTHLYNEWLLALQKKGISPEEANRALKINQACLKLCISLLQALDK